MKIKLEQIPQDFFLEYNLIPFVHNGWVYFGITRGCYGLPQYRRLANDLSRKRLNKAGYFEAVTTPGIWKHTWRPIQFCLIVDDFRIEYICEKHVHHQRSVLQEHYEITENWNGTRFAGLDMEWNYIQRHLD